MSSATVVHFTDTVGFGGAERMLLAVLGGLDRQRWRPVLMHYANPSALRLAAEARQLDVETRIAPHRNGDGRGAPPLIGLARALHAERTAVVHAHLAWPLRCTRGLVAARLAAVPAVLATQQLFSALPSRRAVLKHRVVAAAVDRYIAVSNEMEQAMRAVVPRQKLTTIPNGVRLDDFARPRSVSMRGQLFDDDARSLVLTVARLVRHKGLDQLLRAAVLVPRARFVVAGDGADRARLEAEAVALGVAHRVSFLGERNDVAQLLANADVFVLPSLLEGLPISVLEAMAAAVPVVAVDATGSREAVGDAGELVPPHAPAALAAAIQRLLDDPERARRLAEAGRQRVRHQFSLEATVGRVMELYDETLARSRRPRAYR